MNSAAPALGRAPSEAELDESECRAIIARGSKSFALASLALPKRIRTPAQAFYAYCRYADDCIDESKDPAAQLERLESELADCVRGRPASTPQSANLARLLDEYQLPPILISGLLEGFRWDVEGREYHGLEDLLECCVRVASTVGLAMCWFMGERDARVLARASELGMAMQLTNIARDVGTDAQAGRVYIPTQWFRNANIDNRRALLDAPTTWRAEYAPLVSGLCQAAEPLYARAELGIAALPRDCRLSIKIAARVYREIGRQLAQSGYDSVSQRSIVPTGKKILCALQAWLSRAPLRAYAHQNQPISPTPQWEHRRDAPPLAAALPFIEAISNRN